MSEDIARQLQQQLGETRNRYTYFLLAAAASAIAFAVNQTRDAELTASQALLGAAVLSWAASIFCGCRYLQYLQSILVSNFELNRVQAGRHPDAGQHSDAIQAASEGIRSGIESNAKKSGQFADVQFYLLIVGAGLYLCWHVLEMARRSMCAV